jgi:hypothetical protein
MSKMIRGNNRRRPTRLTDRELVADAARRVLCPITTGRSSTTRTRAFGAEYRGLCGRCGRGIDRGDWVRFHADFTGVVHSGCHPPKVLVTKIVKAAVTGSRQPSICAECNLAHAGECW